MYYFLETLNKKDYFGRKATFLGVRELLRFYHWYMLKEGFLLNSCTRHFPTLIHQYPHSFFFRLWVLKENRLEPDPSKLTKICRSLWHINYLLVIQRDNYNVIKNALSHKFYLVSSSVSDLNTTVSLSNNFSG